MDCGKGCYKSLHDRSFAADGKNIILPARLLNKQTNKQDLYVIFFRGVAS